MPRIALLYIFFSVFLIAYALEISSTLERIGNATFAGLSLLIIGLPLSIRLLVLRLHEKALRACYPTGKRSVASLPWRELYSDLAIWLAIGMAIGLLAGFSSGHYWASAAQLGCFSLMIGLVIGAFNFLHMERAIIAFLQERPDLMGVPRTKTRSSVASRLTLLIYLMMIVSGVFIGTIIVEEALSIVRYCPDLKDRISNRMAYEIGAVALVMLAVSVLITRQFITNLNVLLKLQIDALARVGKGAFDVTIPVATTDEFGLIASHTNEMIDGLREREHIRATFGKYVSKEIRDVILSTGLPTGGETRNVTILFCDLRGFTSFVEQSSPSKVVEKLNQYFTLMCREIENRQGLVLQFIGDEIEAVFGAPLDLEDHPSIAVETAIGMRMCLAELNRRWQSQGDEPFQHGIGVHTGEVVAASIGSPERLSYLMVGDTVNLASRIQDMTKELGCDILLSGNTRRHLSGRFAVQQVGIVRVKGREQETELFKVL